MVMGNAFSNHNGSSAFSSWVAISLIKVIIWNKELLGSWTLSIVWYSINQKTRRFGNWICFRPQVRGNDTYSVGSLRKS
jgi:hypothetical protein